MEQLLQSLNVMLLGMCGIFIVMSVLSLAIALLNRMFKSEWKKLRARPGDRAGALIPPASVCTGFFRTF